jgi:hypothetical protein
MTWTQIDSKYVGQIWVSGSGVKVQGPNITNQNGFLLKSHPSNTAIMWILNNGGTSGCGFPISASEVFHFVGTNLNLVNFEVVSNTSSSMCWAKL